MFRVKLRELRENAGYKSQQAFADAFGVAQSTVAGWESGKREPNYETTIRIARFFRVSLDYLLDHEDTEKRPAPDTESGPLYPPEYNLLNPEDRELVDGMIRSLAKKKSTD